MGWRGARLAPSRSRAWRRCRAPARARRKAACAPGMRWGTARTGASPRGWCSSWSGPSPRFSYASRRPMRAPSQSPGRARCSRRPRATTKTRTDAPAARWSIAAPRLRWEAVFGVVIATARRCPTNRVSPANAPSLFSVRGDVKMVSLTRPSDCRRTTRRFHGLPPSRGSARQATCPECDHLHPHTICSFRRKDPPAFRAILLRRA
jgi:hypothetical protein